MPEPQPHETGGEEVGELVEPLQCVRLWMAKFVRHVEEHDVARAK